MQPAASTRVRRLTLALGLMALMAGGALAAEASWRAGKITASAEAKAEEAQEEGLRWVDSLQLVSAGRQLAHFEERRRLLEAFTQARRQRALGVLLALVGGILAAGSWVVGRIEHQITEIDALSS